MRGGCTRALHAGRALEGPSRRIDGAGYFSRACRAALARGYQVATFDAGEVFESGAAAVRLLETMATDGVVVVHGMEAPSASTSTRSAAQSTRSPAACG